MLSTIHRATPVAMALVSLVASGVFTGGRSLAQETARIDPLASFAKPVKVAYGESANNAGAVVGTTFDDQNRPFAVLWRSPGSVLDVEPEGDGLAGEAMDLSGDGSVVVGHMSLPGGGTGAFVWRAGEGSRYLPTLDPLQSSFAYAVTSDGKTIVGSAWDPTQNARRAARWSRSGPPLILESEVAGYQTAYDISSDGTWIVVSTADGGFLWSEATGMTPLGDFLPRAVSADGRTVVGHLHDGTTSRAVIWRTSSGAQFLPISIRVTASAAYSISDDGRTIVGYQQLHGTSHACVWRNGSPFFLRDYLISRYGLALEDWPYLGSPEAVSPDGRVIVGWGTFRGKNRGYRVTLPNAVPIANAGKNVVVEARNDRGVRVRLDGAKSRDPEQHALKFRWTGSKIRFDDPTASKPIAKFPVGRTVVTLRVTDELGARDTDTATVTVRLANSRVRPQGDAANEWFAHAADRAERATLSGDLNAAALEGLVCASAADAIGEALGDLVVWSEEESVDEATLRYAELRALQLAYGRAAAAHLAEAAAHAGDGQLLDAAIGSHRGTLHALSDLGDP